MVAVHESDESDTPGWDFQKYIIFGDNPDVITARISNVHLAVLRMQGADEPSRLPRTLFTFHSQADIEQFATGCDADIGGTSTVNLDLDESSQRNASIGTTATAKFWGDMRLGVKAGLEGKLRGGYAGFRNKVSVVLIHVQLVTYPPDSGDPLYLGT